MIKDNEITAQEEQTESSRRKLLKGAAWSAPVVLAVSLPIHGQATNAEEQPEQEGPALTGATCADGPAPGSRTFTEPGTHEFTVPECVTEITVEARGAGGGGGGGGATGDHDQAGDGGEGARGQVLAPTVYSVTPGTVLTVEVGEGGAGGGYGDYEVSLKAGGGKAGGYTGIASLGADAAGGAGGGGGGGVKFATNEWSNDTDQASATIDGLHTHQAIVTNPDGSTNHDINPHKAIYTGGAQAAMAQDGHQGGAGGLGEKDGAPYSAQDGEPGEPGYMGNGSGAPDGGAGGAVDPHFVTGTSDTNSEGNNGQPGLDGTLTITW